AVFAMFLLNKLPLLYYPMFKSKNFRRATQDRFFLAIEARDRYFDPDATAAFLKDNRAMSTELIDE
ncbi:MAG: quinol:electron acceptor oxidoreductase subunit ActD, partial [Planctomycetota bacterium]